MTYAIESGLIVGPEPGQCAGYVFNFEGHGAYDPVRKITVGNLELTQEQVDTHNKLLGEAEMKAACERGKGLFYFMYEGNKQTGYRNFRVINWSSTFTSPHVYARRSFAPGFNCSTRWHVYFTGPDGKQWYGINQGDSQMCRARRMARQRKGK